MKDQRMPLLQDRAVRKFAVSLFERVGLTVSRNMDSYDDLARVLRGVTITSIVDGGAAKGTETARLADLFPGATVSAFEPHPKAFARLKAQFDGSSRVALFPVAISDTEGTMALNLSAKPTQTSLLKAVDPKMVTVGSVDVEVTTLARLIESGSLEPPQLVKLDLQGAELAALKGLGRFMGQVQAILVEVSFRTRYAGACLYHDLAAELARSDMRLFRLSDIHTHHSGAWLRADAVFLRGALLDSLMRQGHDGRDARG